uniref:Uncharacterized protein n=1 Tax=Caenorhabditis japonica TaxID=281687 RepID=A0A8R1DK22_CAEJA
MTRAISVLFLIFFLRENASAFPLSDGAESDNLTELRSPHGKEDKEEKLEDEFEKIRNVIQTDTVVVQENVELKINDAIEMKNKLENFTVAKFRISTTESSKSVSVAEPSIDGVDGLEAGEEQARQTNENELAELSEKFKEKIDPTGGVTENKTTIVEVKNLEPSQVQEESEEEEEDEGKTEIEVNDFVQESPNSPTKAPNEHEILEPTQKSQFSEEFPRTSSIIIGEPVKEKQEAFEKLKKEQENSKLTWELLEFLFMLAPADEEEVTWWAVVLEAVKCSLRNCPNSGAYWLHRPVYLPRITRHRRQDIDFDPTANTENSKKEKPCPCKNLEMYLEKLYERTNRKNEKQQENN